jgi:predicted SAM-dependent methyltransferase
MIKAALIRLSEKNGLLQALLRSRTRIVGARRLKKQLRESPKRKIVVGSAGLQSPGWIATDIQFLNLLKVADWDRFFRADSLDTILAEHVWEHLTCDEGLQAARTCFRFLKTGGYIRVAVPDGLHPDPSYIDYVQVGGPDDHKMVYTYKTLRDIFEKSGYRVQLYEYFDEAHKFHFQAWNPEDGMISRSKRFDERNKDGVLNYTSVILDAFKP